MKVRETHLKGCFELSPNIIYDDRGYFFESFNKRSFYEDTGISTEFVQDNQSKSSRGVLRGLHFQIGDFAQAKLVRVVNGSVLDVCVDLREDSPTFLQHSAIVLDAKQQNQVYIPGEFAHGFLVLENNTVLSYKCNNYYNQDNERGLIYNDPTLQIDWGMANKDFILSKKDLALPSAETYFK